MLFFLWPTNSDSFPLVIIAAIAGGNTCLFGSLSVRRFRPPTEDAEAEVGTPSF